ncbi:MAG: VWA domain-containing protein [Pseudomonadota bacterium]
MDVQFLEGQEPLAFTAPCPVSNPVSIAINARVLDEPQGEALLRGLMLHEIGHHYAHFSDPAYQETMEDLPGADYLFNILADEHLERRLRSLNASWGELFDELAAWAFKSVSTEYSVQELAYWRRCSVSEIRQSVMDGNMPGVVTGYEFGFQVQHTGDKWMTTAELVDALVQEIFARCDLATDRSLHEAKQKARSDLVRLISRKGNEYTAEDLAQDLRHLVDHAYFSIRGLKFVVRQKVSQLLARRGAESPGEYLERITRIRAPLFEKFPMLNRYVVELERSRSSEWFWHKQRSMLSALIRGADFQHAFNGVEQQDIEALREVLPGIMQPSDVLADFLSRLEPVPRLNMALASRIKLTWFEMLRTELLRPLNRFMISLRLGLGTSGLNPNDVAVRSSLELVTGGLRRLDVAEIRVLRDRISELLGSLSASAPIYGTYSSPRRPGGRLLDGHIEDESPLIAAAAEQAANLFEQWLTADSDENADSAFQLDPRPAVRRAERLPRKVAGSSARGQDWINVAKNLDFPRMETIEEESESLEAYEDICRSIRPMVRRLRQVLGSLGVREVERTAQTTGTRLDLARAKSMAIYGEPRVLVRSEEEPGADLFIGVLIDSSASMGFDAQRLDKAKAFATLIAESTKAFNDTSSRFWGFNHNTIFDLGSARSRRIASLVADGGNNDAGALHFAVQQALVSRHARRILIMISDGFPTECSFESLKELVALLPPMGIVCAQVAVSEMEEDLIAFPNYVDLSGDDFGESVARFGRLLEQLINSTP